MDPLLQNPSETEGGLNRLKAGQAHRTGSGPISEPEPRKMSLFNAGGGGPTDTTRRWFRIAMVTRGSAILQNEKK